MDKKDIAQVFDTEFNCYTHVECPDGECISVPAMDKPTFIDIVTILLQANTVVNNIEKVRTIKSDLIELQSKYINTNIYIMTTHQNLRPVYTMILMSG